MSPSLKRWMPALLLIAGAGCSRQSPPDLALEQCKAHYDILMRYVTGHMDVPQTPEGLLKAAEIGAGDKDPWGRRYAVTNQAGHLRVWSDGPDRKTNTEDDLCYPPLRDR